MPIHLGEHSRNDMIALAQELTGAYRSLKSQGLKTEIDPAVEAPRFTEDTLYIPRPTSLNNALYTILFGSLLFDNRLDISTVPAVLRHQTQLVANLLELAHRNTIGKTEILTLETVSKRSEDRPTYFMHVDHKHFEVDDTSITFILLSNQIHIQTAKAIFLKPADGLVKRPLVKTTVARYNAKSTDYKVKLPLALHGFTAEIEGEYTFIRK